MQFNYSQWRMQHKLIGGIPSLSTSIFTSFSSLLLLLPTFFSPLHLVLQWSFMTVSPPSPLVDPHLITHYLGCIWHSFHSWFFVESRALPNSFFKREVIFCWFYEMILWNEVIDWELEKVASLNVVEWFSILKSLGRIKKDNFQT